MASFAQLLLMCSQQRKPPECDLGKRAELLLQICVFRVQSREREGDGRVLRGRPSEGSRRRRRQTRGEMGLEGLAHVDAQLKTGTTTPAQPGASQLEGTVSDREQVFPWMMRKPRGRRERPLQCSEATRPRAKPEPGPRPMTLDV